MRSLLSIRLASSRHGICSQRWIKLSERLWNKITLRSKWRMNCANLSTCHTKKRGITQSTPCWKKRARSANRWSLHTFFTAMIAIGASFLWTITAPGSIIVLVTTTRSSFCFSLSMQWLHWRMAAASTWSHIVDWCMGLPWTTHSTGSLASWLLTWRCSGWGYSLCLMCVSTRWSLFSAKLGWLTSWTSTWVD